MISGFEERCRPIHSYWMHWQLISSDTIGRSNYCIDRFYCPERISKRGDREKRNKRRVCLRLNGWNRKWSAARARGERVGRNPRTGESVDVAKKHLPFFKTGKELRERVNTNHS